MSSVRPAYLLADSRLLFADPGARSPVLRNLRDHFEHANLSAAYVGAANGDQQEFYGLFEAVMEDAGISDRRQIRSSFDTADRDYLANADVVLLAGGDVAHGWEVMTGTGMQEVLVERFFGGAVFIGISAGAVHLGLQGFRPADQGEEWFPTLALIPFVFDAHDEDNAWARLHRSVRAAGPHQRGLGLPSGGGLIYHPDHSVQPLVRPVVEVTLDQQRVVENLLLP